MIDSAIYTEQGQVKVYSSPRPFGTSTYFSGAGDTATERGAGERILFKLLTTDTVKIIDITYNSDVYLKDGYMISELAPFGAYMDVEVVHPLAGVVGVFCKKVPIFSSFPIPLDTEDRALIPAGLIIRISIYNSNGILPQDPPGAFKVAGRIETYRI